MNQDLCTWATLKDNNDVLYGFQVIGICDKSMKDLYTFSHLQRNLKIISGSMENKITQSFSSTMQLDIKTKYNAHRCTRKIFPGDSRLYTRMKLVALWCTQTVVSGVRDLHS